MPDRDEIRAWLADTLGRRRSEELELARQLEALEQGPLERLSALVRLVVSELREAQRRLGEQAHDLSSLQRTVVDLAERVAELEGQVHVEAPPPPVAAGHLLLLATREGYRLADRPGPPPAPDDALLLDGVRYRALRAGPSPLPGDDRRCVLLLPD